MTIYFRILSNEVDNFLREVCIDDSASFLDLHLFIQSCLGFESSHMASFILTDGEWNRQKEVSMINMSESDTNVSLMGLTQLKELVINPKQRLLYVYDFFSERAFFMEVFCFTDVETLNPKLEKSIGNPPNQIEVGDILSPVDDDCIIDDDNKLEIEFNHLDILDFDNLPEIEEY